MGYVTNVYLMCEEKAFHMFKKAWKDYDFSPDKVLLSSDTYIINWEWVKWYSEFNYIQAIENVCSTLCNEEYNNKESYAFKKIEIGEDNDVVINHNERGFINLDFYVTVSVNIPQNAELISI